MDLDKLDLLNFEEDNDDDLGDLGLGLDATVPVHAPPTTGNAGTMGVASVPPTTPGSVAAVKGAAHAATVGPVVTTQSAAASMNVATPNTPGQATVTATPASQRKRPRSTSPVPPDGRAAPGSGVGTSTTKMKIATHLAAATAAPDQAVPPVKKPLTSVDIARQIIDDKTRNATLNKLLKTTSSHDDNYALDSDDILKALVRVFNEVIGWDKQKLKVKDDFVDIPTMADKFTAKAAWVEPLTAEAAAWAQYCRDTLCNKSHRWETEIKPDNSDESADTIIPKRLQSDDVRCLETILMIFRNLSFVAANLRLMAYSPDVVSILVGCMYQDSTLPSSSWSLRFNSGAVFDENHFSSSNMTLASSSISTLQNLIPYLDVTGDRLFADKLFLKSAMALPGSTSAEEGPILPDKETFGQVVDSSWGFGSLIMAKKLDTKEDVVQDVTKDEIVEITKDYLVAVWSMFPALTYLLLNTGAQRGVIVSAIELLQEFINHARAGLVGNAEDEEDPHAIPTTRVILVYIPVELLHRLAEFLYVPRFNSDSLDFADPADFMVTRVHPLFLMRGYESNIDTELRDKSLDVLVPLLELDSPRMAGRLGTKENGLPNVEIFDSIIPILSMASSRGDATGLASQLLGELSKAKENHVGCKYLEERIVTIASSDSRVAQLAFNSMYTHA